MTTFFTADTHFDDNRTINLDGHSHDRLKPLIRQLDVGVDGRGWATVTLAQLLPPKP